jgi:3-oxoacyl-[acyl-carrier protein] reductase
MSDRYHAPLTGKVALITGSGRGIGQQIALRLARAGASIVVNDLDEGPATETVDKIKADGGEATAVVGNVLDDDFADRFVDTAVQEYGGVHVIVNNAGFTWDNVIQKMSDEQFDTIVGVHLKAPFRILRAAQPVISAAVKAEHAEGRVVHRKVVNISSLSAVAGNAGQSNYSAAKAGLEGLTRALAKEWGRLHVNVNAVAFGLIATRLTQATDAGATIDVEGREIKVGVNPQLLAAMESLIPLGRAGSPEEAAGAVYLLCTPEADYVSGQTLLCAGGALL